MEKREVYEIDKETFDSWRQEFNKDMELVRELRKYVEAKKEKDPWIPVEEFMERCKVGESARYQMQKGTHPSGFHLETFRKEGTKQVATSWP